MSSEKKLAVKRLMIFLAISFLPFYIIIPVMWSCYGMPIYAAGDDSLAVPVYLLGVFGMMIPSCANIITRLVTKEGFKNTYLGLNCKGRMGWYAASVWVKLAESMIAACILCTVYLGGIQLTGLNAQGIGLFLLQLAASVIMFFPAFGEEWGWRGYMMPKLLTLMPKPAAVVAGGVIWGLWHAPLTVAGHNFGVDYPGYPFAGIGLMCVMCVLMNAFLTLVTEKTKSIYPAAFCHSVNNNLGAGIIISLFSGEEAALRLDELPATEVMLYVLGIMLITGTVSMTMLSKNDN